MTTLDSIMRKAGGPVCRRCICRQYDVDLKREDCVYAYPFPQTCAVCGEYRNIVTGLRLSGRLKLLLK